MRENECQNAVCKMQPFCLALNAFPVGTGTAVDGDDLMNNLHEFYYLRFFSGWILYVILKVYLQWITRIYLSQ